MLKSSSNVIFHFRVTKDQVAKIASPKGGSEGRNFTVSVGFDGRCGPRDSSHHVVVCYFWSTKDQTMVSARSIPDVPGIEGRFSRGDGNSANPGDREVAETGVGVSRALCSAVACQTESLPCDVWCTRPHPSSSTAYHAYRMTAVACASCQEGRGICADGREYQR